MRTAYHLRNIFTLVPTYSYCVGRPTTDARSRKYYNPRVSPLPLAKEEKKTSFALFKTTPRHLSNASLILIFTIRRESRHLVNLLTIYGMYQYILVLVFAKYDLRLRLYVGTFIVAAASAA